MTAVAMTTDLPPLAARPWWRQWGALRHVARLRTAAMFAYRNTMLLFLGVSIVQIFMLKKVWGRSTPPGRACWRSPSRT